MRTLLFVVLALSLALVACKPTGSPRLEGRWRGVRVEGVPPEATDAATAFAKSSEIIAKGNQIAVSTPASKLQATYFVDAEDKNTVVIHTDKDGPNAKETLIVAEDGKALTWRLGDGRAIHFARVEN